MSKLLLLVVAGAHCFVPTCLWEANPATAECIAGLPRVQTYERHGRAMSMLWTAPEDESSTSGLGGGITWAWDPELCDELCAARPHQPEICAVTQRWAHALPSRGHLLTHRLGPRASLAITAGCHSSMRTSGSPHWSPATRSVP